MPDQQQPDVLCTVDGRIGSVVLNRPKAINSLTAGMLADIAAALQLWATAPGVDHVVLTGAGERGLCAGGDVRAMWLSARAGDGLAREFFRTEYRVNAQVARFPKPFVAMMDGIVMGGGVGLASHADVRVVTERARVAMPEVTIGLVPDVGGTYLLSRAPGESGTHLALTGAAVGAGDAIWLGLADHFVPYERLSMLLSALRDSGPAEASALLAEPPPEPVLAGYGWLDACYAYDTVEEILGALKATGDPDAAAAAALIETKSPTALKVTLESLRRARGLATPRGGARAGVPRLVRLPRVSRPRRGHPGPGHRQGPQPGLVPGGPGRRRPGLRRELLRRPRPRCARAGTACERSPAEKCGDPFAVIGRVAEERIVGAGAAEEQVRVVLPREPGATVQMHRLGGDLDQGLGAPRVGHRRSLGEPRRVGVGVLCGLDRATDGTAGGLDLEEHVRAAVLDRLEAADGAAELAPGDDEGHGQVQGSLCRPELLGSLRQQGEVDRPVHGAMAVGPASSRVAGAASSTSLA